ncbi:hypothetical protein B0T18DRAFT_123760 [Schizothecium vesticola]|uniref:Uncharacterized protein n=1 Tax=Schizothecium vesticola TaxID=314040 RepID=A0AA40F361_9PEZI|nr:hypothetical protein B0T18DRAFT_123760 [Schizothecium vesticola]
MRPSYIVFPQLATKQIKHQTSLPDMQPPNPSSLVPRIIPRTPTPPLRVTPPHLPRRHHIRPRRPPRLFVQLLVIHHHHRPRRRRPMPAVVPVRAVVVPRPRPPVAVPAARPPVRRGRSVVVPPLPVRFGRRRGRLVVARERAHDPPDQEEANDGADDDADDGAGVEARFASAAARVGAGAGVGGDDGGGGGVGEDGDGCGGRVLSREEVGEEGGGEGEGRCWCHLGGGGDGWGGTGGGRVERRRGSVRSTLVGWNGFAVVYGVHESGRTALGGVPSITNVCR